MKGVLEYLQCGLLLTNMGLFICVTHEGCIIERKRKEQQAHHFCFCFFARPTLTN